MSEFMEDPDSLSGNDLSGEPDPVTPEPEEPGTETPEPGKNEDQEGKEEPGKTPEENAGDQQEETGSDQQLDIEDIMERLDLLGTQEDSEEPAGVMERLDLLIQLFTPEETGDGIETYAAAFSFEGNEDWEYHIWMQFKVYPYGLGNWLEQKEMYNNPESFVSRYEEIVSLCKEGGTLKDFYVMYIWEDYTGDWETLVYDYQAVVEPEPEPEPGEEEPGEAVELLLSHLENINATLAEMQQADLEYYQAVYDYQAEMLEMQTADTGATIILCIAVLAVLGELIIKHLLEVFR